MQLVRVPCAWSIVVLVACGGGGPDAREDTAAATMPPQAGTGGGCSPTELCDAAFAGGGCGCHPGARSCHGDALVECAPSGSCLELVEQCDCVWSVEDGSGFCANGAEDCDRVRDLYAQHATRFGARPAEEVTTRGPQVLGCSTAEGCTVRHAPDAHCAAGLSACWYLESAPSTPNPELERLFEIYVRLGCDREAVACDCSKEPPSEIACLEGDPSWSIPGFGGGFTYACVVGEVAPEPEK